MNYGQLQAQLSALLNRRNATTAQIQSWLQSGLQRIQRELRCPAMEKTVLVTIADGYSGLVIPSDMIELIDLLNQNGDRITKSDITTVNELAKTTGTCRNYYRLGGKWLLGHAPAVGDVITIVYYAELGDLVNSSDENIISQIASDLVLYAGLGFAGLFYTDVRKGDWESTYQTILGDLQGQSDDDELSGGSCVSLGIVWPDDSIGT